MSFFNYRTNIDLKSTNSTENQLVLASQICSTFFCIYINLEKVKGEVDFYNINFNVRTYRGCFSIGIDDVEIEEIIPGLTHIKLHTNITKTNYTNSHKIKLKKDSYLIFEREESKNLNTNTVFTNERSYINLKPGQQGDNKTQYQIEKDIVAAMIQALKAQNLTFPEIIEELTVGNTNNLVSKNTQYYLTAASESFCVIGFNKVI